METEEIQLPYSQLSKWDKFSEFKQICFARCERHHGAVYLKALWLNDTETLNEFERFGEDLYSIMLNKRTYDQALIFGYNKIEFDNNGWLIEPKLLNKEVISFDIKGRNTINRVEVEMGINGKWVNGVHTSSNTAGMGSGSSIWLIV